MKHLTSVSGRLARWVVLAGCLMPAAAAAQPSTAGTAAARPPFALHSGGRCLEVNPPQLRVEGARVQLAACDGDANQAWQHDRGRVVNQANGHCLDLHEPDVGYNGGRLQTVSCNGGANQSWRFERGRIVSIADGRCIDAVGAEGERGPAQVQTWDCDARRVERWAVTRLGAPALARDVEAGPIFSNAEAEARCPAVCAPARWTRAWRTTEIGRMSVCNCIDDSADWRPEGSAAPPPMAERRFAELMRAIETEPFAPSKIAMLEAAARDHHFVVAQLRRIVYALRSPVDRMRAVEIVAPRIVDREQFFSLFSAFDLEYEKAQVRDIFDRLGPD